MEDSIDRGNESVLERSVRRNHRVTTLGPRLRGGRRNVTTLGPRLRGGRRNATTLGPRLRGDDETQRHWVPACAGTTKRNDTGSAPARGRRNATTLGPRLR